MVLNHTTVDDVDAAVELRLFIDNDYELYKQQTVPIMLNVQRKVKKGTYDPAKAVKLWMYLVDSGAKKYIKQFCAPDDTVKQIFPKPLREAVAKELAEHWEAELAVGNFIER